MDDEEIARLQRLVSLTEANQRSREEQQRLESVHNEIAGLRQASADEAQRQRLLPQCPACGGRLDGEFRKCRHCASDLVWIDGHACEPGQEEVLRQRLAAEKDTAAAIKRRNDAAGQPFVNSVGMRFVAIAPGEFIMGGAAGDVDADPVEERPHPVRITKSFYLGIHPVSQSQYVQVMGNNPSLYRGDDLPVEHLHWHDAVEFCYRLSSLPTEKALGRRYRLPTEAEWEYACRAGSTSAYSFGDFLLPDQARYFRGAVRLKQVQPTAPNGSYPPNAWGLYDMHGNVWEWTSDWYSRDYYGRSPVEDPAGPTTGTHHTLRGGSASVFMRECRCSSRGESMGDGPGTSNGYFSFYGDFGLRVACVIQPYAENEEVSSAFPLNSVAPQASGCAITLAIILAMGGLACVLG